MEFALPFGIVDIKIEDQSVWKKFFLTFYDRHSQWGKSRL